MTSPILPFLHLYEINDGFQAQSPYLSLYYFIRRQVHLSSRSNSDKNRTTLSDTLETEEKTERAIDPLQKTTEDCPSESMKHTPSEPPPSKESS